MIPSVAERIALQAEKTEKELAVDALQRAMARWRADRKTPGADACLRRALAECSQTLTEKDAG